MNLAAMITNAYMDCLIGEVEHDAARAAINEFNKNSTCMMIGEISCTKKDPKYGFINSRVKDPVFLHSTKGTLKQGDIVLCIYTTVNGKLRATKWCDINEKHVTDMTNDEVYPFIEKYIETSYNNAVRAIEGAIAEAEARKRAEEAAFAAEEAKILGSVTVKVTNEHRDGNYGGHYSATFTFSEPITVDTFHAFIEHRAHTATAKPCYAPICAERVEIRYSKDMTVWEYKWSGEWDD